MTLLMRDGDSWHPAGIILSKMSPGSAVSLDCHTSLGCAEQKLQGMTVLWTYNIYRLLCN